MNDDIYFYDMFLELISQRDTKDQAKGHDATASCTEEDTIKDIQKRRQQYGRKTAKKNSKRRIY